MCQRRKDSGESGEMVIGNHNVHEFLECYKNY